MFLEDFLTNLDRMAARHNKPHKFILLLTIIDLLELKLTNQIKYDEVLKKLFTKYIRKFNFQIADRPYIPFFHLKTDGFWHLKPNAGKELDLSKMSTVAGPRELTDNVEYGYFSEDVFILLQDDRNRNLVRNKLLSILHEYSSLDNVQHIKEESSPYFLKKSSLFEHEQKAINKIVSLIGETTKALANVNLVDNQSKSYLECDLIVISPSGIYVVELKHWSGNIEIKQYQWLINKTKYRTDPHKNNSFKCKVLKGLYEHNLPTFPNVWVESVVVLTNPDASVENADTPDIAYNRERHNYTFASIADFVSFLKRRDAKMAVLDNSQVSAIANFIAGLDKPKIKQIEYFVNGYETVEYLSQHPECIELLARPIGIKARGLHRLRVFRQIQEDPKERERLRRIALNTLNAVEQIGDNPYILKVWAIQNEDGDIIEVSDWSETGTLQDLIYEAKGRLPLEQALEMCKNIALGLKEAHKNNIIHRAIKPENILISNNIPKLMNFDLSYQLEDHRLTVIPDASKIKDDGYVAPELLMGGDIDESTDFYSLGVIAYQLLTGEKPFRSSRDFFARGGYLSSQQIQKLENAEVPERIIDLLKNMIVAERSKRLRNIDTIISTFSGIEEQKSIPEEAIPDNSKLSPGDKDRMFEIVEFVGQGAETQLYKAKVRLSPKDEPATVVLKVFNREVSMDRVLRELEIGREIRSPYVVRYESRPDQWKDKRFFIVMEYVPGPTLRQIIENGERPNRVLFNHIALSLMEGIRALHEWEREDGTRETIVHGDIKPDNIIIAPKQKPVLIDLGIAGPPRVDVFQGTTGYVPPDSILGVDRDFSPRGDLFAFGVTLWEWLFGKKPYDNPAIGDKPHIPEDLPEFRDLYPWLEKAVATEPSKGFSSIAEMWSSFTKSLEEEKPPEESDVVGDDEEAVTVIDVSVPDENFVWYLNSLSNASAGNENAIAECQIRNQNFQKIHIPNPIVNVICRLLDDGRNVILTGNAGDGKTTIAVDVVKKFGEENLLTLNPRHEVAGHSLVVIKDMSELPKEERVAVLKEAMVAEKSRYLIVSNTGTLLDSFRALKDNRCSNYSGLLNALKASEPVDVVDNHFCLINIGQLDSIKTACRVFERMLQPDNWTECSQCRLYGDCPIITNVNVLQSNLDLAINRIYLLYKRLYEYGQRLTMRQMTGHLAYALTGGLHCRDVASMSIMARKQHIWRSGFFNRFFGDDGSNIIPEATKLVPVRVIREAGFGAKLIPSFERKAWLKEETFKILNQDARNIYEEMLKGFSPKAISNPIFRQQIRRLVYFYGRFTDEEERAFIPVFLDSPMLLDYLEITDSENPPSQAHLRKLCIKVLHILQEHFTGFRLPEDSWKNMKDIFITLKLPENVTAVQMVLARFRDDDFNLVVEPRYQYDKASGGSRMFVLQYMTLPNVRLTLDLPFFDYVARRYDGDMTYQLSAYYSNRLDDFKAKLLQADTSSFRKKTNSLQLMRIRPDRGFDELNLLVSEDELEVI